MGKKARTQLLSYNILVIEENVPIYKPIPIATHEKWTQSCHYSISQICCNTQNTSNKADCRSNSLRSITRTRDMRCDLGQMMTLSRRGIHKCGSVKWKPFSVICLHVSATGSSSNQCLIRTDLKNSSPCLLVNKALKGIVFSLSDTAERMAPSQSCWIRRSAISY